MSLFPCFGVFDLSSFFLVMGRLVGGRGSRDTGTWVNRGQKLGKIECSRRDREGR